MKKIIFLFAIAGLVALFGCNSLDDIHDEIDAIEKPVVGDEEYTLTDEDYDALELSYGNFSSEDDAKTILPAFLSAKYPVWGKGSSVLVGYKLYVGSAPGVSDYTYADSYRLSQDDYPKGAMGAIGFFPDEDPADHLADALASNVSDAADGDNILVKYKKYVGEPVAGFSNYYEVDFTDGSLHSYEVISKVGDQVWEGSQYGAKVSGYSGGSQNNEDWLISPEIDLTSQENLTIQLTQIVNYSTQLDLLSILISTDYSTGGDPATATWEELTVNTWPEGKDWDPVQSEEIDFGAYEGEKIHIAFKYTSTTETSATWEIVDMVIKAAGVEGETMNAEIFYTLDDGDWEEAEGVYFIQDADFDAMGEDYGRPGYYNNFSSSISPDDYLPAFMGKKFPYGQEADEMFVIYDYYSSSSGAQLRGNLFTVVNGEWMGHESTINTTLQFGHDGSTWVPDNTIKYTLTAADYDHIIETLGSKYPSETANMNSYGNFNGFSWDPDMILEAVGAVMMKNYPDAAEGQKFTVTYSIYDGSTHDEDIYIILKGGSYVFQ